LIVNGDGVAAGRAGAVEIQAVVIVDGDSAGAVDSDSGAGEVQVLAAPTVNAKFEAPVLKVKPPIVVVAVENVRLVVLDGAKDAVPVGTVVLGFQFVAVSKSLVAGLASHVASTARAAVLEGATPMARTPTYNTRRARMLLRSRPLVFNPSIKTPSENIPVSRVVRSYIPLREELK
jgi:hypothetical protein